MLRSRAFVRVRRGKTACILPLSIRFAPLVAVRLVNGNQPLWERVAGVAAGPALCLLYLVRVFLYQMVKAVLQAAVVGGDFGGVLGLVEKDNGFALVFG